MSKAKRLRFELQVPSAGGIRANFALHQRLCPNGGMVLNKTEWRGKEPRSCRLDGMTMRPHSVGDSSPFVLDIEIAYRPKGAISYTGRTRYDGWTAMIPKRRSDGVFLGHDDQPLKDGESRVYVPKEVYGEADFNDIDLGTFIGEYDAEEIKRTTEDAVFEALKASGKFSFSLHGGFIAPHRNRPHKKIVISANPTGIFIDGFGTHIINVNKDTNQLEEILLDRLEELMCEFIEGKASIKCMSNSELAFVELSDSLVDVTPNEDGLDSWFNMLRSYTPIDFLDDLAKRVMSVYAVDAEVIDGKGLVLRHVPDK